MRKTLLLLLTLLFCFPSFSCSDNTTYIVQEHPVTYTQDIEVVITSIEKKQWFAGTAQREVNITVYSEEYNLSGKATEHYMGMFGSMPLWEYEKGDKVKARMITTIMKSTGQIINRFIDKVY